MTLISDEEQTDMISACLNGEKERDCHWCPANHSKPGGRCCFGIRHEHNDTTCDDCIHNRPCASVTHGGQYVERGRGRIIHPRRQGSNPSRPQARRVSGNRRPPVAHDNYGQHDYGDYGPQPGESLLVQHPPASPQALQLNPEDNLLQRFVKVSMWGAGEGFLEMALNFFRLRRPE